MLPAPLPVLNALTSYGPPTVIASSGSDDFIFAYFPGRNVDGIGACWVKAAALDSWSCFSAINFPAGSGVVAAHWLSSQREVRDTSLIQLSVADYLPVDYKRRRETN
jgi:hypothetical protein